MAFKDIKGQERAIEFFRNSVNRDRLAHAYLFAGPDGLGKALVAKTLAKFLNCENPLKEGNLSIDCCDRCISCRKIENSNHPDVHWVEAKLNAKNISIDQVRSIQKEISLKPYEGKLKVFIIQEAKNLSDQAANCLLKTLEEPPVLSLIILISTNIEGLLPTIISRCQIIKFCPLKLERLKEILTVDYELQSDYAHFLTAQSEGRIGQALNLKEQDAQIKKNRLIDQTTQFNQRITSVDIFNLKDKKELARQIRYLLNWFRDILIFKAGLATSSIINADRMEEIKSLASFYTFEDLEKILTQMIEAHRLIEQNVNSKIALEVMLVGIAKCSMK